MADSRQHRNRFYLLSGVFLLLLVVALVLFNLTSDATSGLKIDLTKDQIYSTSEATREIFGELDDQIKITYYCSSELPERLSTLLRDTVVRFDEFQRYSRHENSEGEVVEHIRYEIIDPESAAERFATEKTDAYMAKYEKGGDLEGLEEPEQPQSIMSLFGGQSRKTDEEVRKEREARAVERARTANLTKEKAYRDLVYEEFQDQYLNELAQEGVQPYIVQDRVGNAVKQVKVYSAIEISYLDRQPEVIPRHFSLESLEYELAYRTLKLTLDQKPVVAFFDSRKPEAPPMNPMQPTPPPPSDYASVIEYLRELADVREVSLKEDDAIDDLLESVKREEVRRAREAAGQKAPEESEEIALEPGDLKRLLRCLVVAQPENLEERQVYEINRVVSSGVPTIFITSRFRLDISDEGAARGYPIGVSSSGLDDLFRRWGVEVGGKMLASNSSGPIVVLQQIPGTRIQVPQLVPIAAVIEAQSEQISKDALLTSGLRGLSFPAACALRTNEKKLEELGLAVERLVHTAEETWEVEVNPFANANNPLQRGQPGATLQNYMDDLVRPKDPERFQDWVGEVAIASYVTGKFPFIYEGESVPAWKPPPPKPEGDEDDATGLPPGFSFPGGGDAAPDAQDPLQDEAESSAEAERDVPDAAETPAGETPAGETPASEEPSGEGPAGEGPAGEGPAGEKPAIGPVEPAPEPAVKAHVEVQDGRVVFVGSSDFLREDYLRLSREHLPYRLNAEFFRNAIQIFTLHDKLVQIRRKNLSVREFTDSAESAAPWIIALNLVGVPAMIALFGLVRFAVRRSAAQRYERSHIQGAATSPPTNA